MKTTCFRSALMRNLRVPTSDYQEHGKRQYDPQHRPAHQSIGHREQLRHLCARFGTVGS